MAEELILPLLGFNGDDEEDDTTDSDEGIGNDVEESDSENTNNGPQRVEYDTTLPSQHNYLGQDLNELSGRVVLDETSFVTMPLLTLPGIVLVPGQVLPLQLYNPSVVSMMKRLIEGQRTIGITSTSDTSFGTTAEIRSYSEDNEEEEGLEVLRIKAEGRQRFRVTESWNMNGILMGKVKILEECELTNPLRLPTYRHIDRTLSACSRWPKWVYQLYDPNLLMDKIKIHLKNWSSISNTETSLCSSQAPSKPCEFSYWVASNLPLDDAQRCQLLAINTPIQRLRWELSLLEKYSYLCCADCKTKICHKDDVIVMSITGPQGTYVNPVGHVWEMITVSKTMNIALFGRASTEFTWFPGYAWTICRCTRCNSHIGWKYSSVNKKLKPEWFWGLCRSSLEPGLKIEEEMSWKPVL